MPTTATCRSTSSRSSSSPATCCPRATLDQKIATGFNRNHRGNGEGGIIPEEYAVEYVVDRVDTTATVWLGLTLGCARCHSHKFDPITQEEFYQLFAFFNNVPENGRAIKLGNSPPLIKTPDPRSSRNSSTRSRPGSPTWSEQASTASPRSRRPRPPGSRRCASPPSTGFRDHSSLATPGRNRPTGRWSTRLPRRPAAALGSSRTASARRPAFLDAGDVAGFGFFDKFTLGAWIKPTGSRGGTILSRMVDEPEGEGYSVVLDRGKVQVNLVKRWLDDAIRVETTAAVARRSMDARRRHLRRLAARRTA